MSFSSTIKSNYFYQVLYRLSICVLPLVITPYIARTLGTTGTGTYSFSSVVACYFIMFSKLGLETYGNRAIARCLDDEPLRAKTFWSIYTLQLITSALSVVVYIGLIQTVFAGQKLIYWIQLLYVLSAMFDTSWYFYGTEQFRLTTIRSLAVRGAIIVFVFLFVRSEQDLPVYTLIMAAAFLAEQLLLLPFLRRIPRVAFTGRDVLRHLKPNLMLFIPLAALNIFNWTDKLMLGILVDNDAVAYYTYAENIINLPKGIVAALGTVMLPRIVKMAAAGDLQGFHKTFAGSVTFIHAISCALCFGIAAVSPVFVPFFLGEAFYATVPLTIGLAAVMLPMSLMDVIQSQYLVPFRRDRIYIQSVVLGTAINLLLNGVLIPVLGTAGAVIGTLGAEFTVCFVQIMSIRKFFSWGAIWRALYPFLIAGGLEFLAAYPLKALTYTYFVTLLLQILAGGAVYLAVCALFLFVIRKDLKNTLLLKGGISRDR